MKKSKLLLLLSFFFVTAFSQIQHIKIVSFTVKNQLPAIIDNWNSIPGALLLVAQKAPTVRLEGVRLVLQIKANGAIVCGNNVATGLPVDNFTTRTFNAGELTGILSGCHELKEGSYMLCAQFFNIDKVSISDEMCKPFSVESPKEIDYAPPTLITPENGKSFTDAELQRPVMFRWTPLVPKPKEAVTYRLRVWQLMQGQNGTQAMRSNQPVITKDIDNITQAVVTGVITGPCRPPYMCDFVWDVQALNREGKPMGRNNGTSEPYTFTMKESSGEIRPPVNISPENNKSLGLNEVTGNITFKWKPVDPKQSGPVTYRLKVWQLMQGQNGTQAMRSNQPIITKEIINVTEATVTGVITGPCRPPYMCDFVWNVEAIISNTAGQTPNTVNSEPTSFTVKNNGEVSTGDIHPPVNISPADNKSFTLDEAKGAIRFSWKGVDPKQPNPVTYRLKVWQLMQGQNGTQAMRSNQPIITKEIINITDATVTGVITGPCRPPYMCDFVWNVEAIISNAAGQTPNTVNSEPTSFTVKNTGEVSTGDIHPPVNISPADNKSFTLDEAKGTIRFSWKGVDPKQSGSVTYRLKVWQLMQGQNGTQAMRSNQPIVTKEVNDLTETVVNGVITGPCRPPYMCDFVWNVQALDKEGHPLGTNNGNSEPTMFMVSQYIIQLDSIKVFCTAKPGVYSFSYTITNPNANTAKLTNFTVTSSAPAGATITSFAPPLNTNIPSNTQLTITGTITGSPLLNNICIGAEITDNVNNFWKAAKDTCINVAPCKCNACDSVKIDIIQKDITFDANGQINLNTNITVSPKPVKSLKAELVYFEYKPENDDCMVCNKDSKTFGNFDKGTLGNTAGAGGGTHSLAWNFSPPKNLIGGAAASMIITVPPTVKCCDATIRWCIRYVVTFEDCTVCNKLVCYEKKKEGCAKGNPNPNGQK